MTTFVLGAGFSQLAGLPLGDDLFRHVLARARNSHLYRNFLSSDLKRYQTFARHTTGERCPVVKTNLERFMSFLDIEHSLALSGPDTWSPQGNKSQLIVRNLIADVLWRAQRKAPPDAIKVYDDFASNLDASDIVITFNYDTLLEESLERVGKRYRLFPWRMVSDEYGWHIADNDREIVILKMHGSIDWFDRAPFEEETRERAARGGGVPFDELFSRETLRFLPLIDSPHPNDTPLVQLYRLKNLHWYLDQATMVRAAPVLISPSFYKILYTNPVKEFWYGFGRGAAYASKVVVIGFSLPSHDEYVKQAIYRLVRNFQHGDRTANTRKAKLTLVDRRTTPQQLAEHRSQFSFVDWRRTSVVLSGFGRDAFGTIFDVPSA